MAKKITAIVSLSIIALLIVATIIMANVKVNYGIKCATPDSVYVSSNMSNFELPTEKQKKDIINLLGNASKESSLNALFNGGLFAHSKVVSDVEKGTTTIKTSANCFYVNYVYNTPQVLKQGNKNYKDADGKTYVYSELCFEVKNTDGTEEVKVYIIPRSSERTRYSLYYLLSADFGKLYSYLATM